MTSKLMSLTDEQKAAMPAYAQSWIERGWRTGRLTEPEWAEWERGGRACYEFAGIPWPGVVVRVPSPLVGAFAAPIAALLIEQAKRGRQSAVGGAVRDAMGGAVDGAVRDAVKDVLRQTWYRRMGGHMWVNWNAYLGFFRDHCDTTIPEEMWDRLAAFDLTTTAGWWWPHRDFVMVADRPDALHLEQVGESGWGSHRLHSDHGPAIGWATDGLYFWHGTRLPADPDEIRTWDTDRILQERNTETRRALIEIVGWPLFVESAGLTQVGTTAADPANPGHELRLYDVPRRIYDSDVRVLVCTNATPERDGTRHVFGLTIPAHIDDPVEAAGWTFGITRTEYAALQAAC